METEKTCKKTFPKLFEIQLEFWKEYVVAYNVMDALNTLSKTVKFDKILSIKELIGNSPLQNIHFSDGCLLHFIPDQKVEDEAVINIIELASELAHRELIEKWSFTIQIYEDETATITMYTEKAQDIFNDLYDKYYTMIEKCKL